MSLVLDKIKIRHIKNTIVFINKHVDREVIKPLYTSILLNTPIMVLFDNLTLDELLSIHIYLHTEFKLFHIVLMYKIFMDSKIPFSLLVIKFTKFMHNSVIYKYITYECIVENPDITELLHPIQLLRNTSISHQWIIDRYITSAYKLYIMEYIATKGSLTTILNNPYICWDWNSISNNRNITKQQYLDNIDKPWHTTNLSYVLPIEDIYDLRDKLNIKVSSKIWSARTEYTPIEFIVNHLDIWWDWTAITHKVLGELDKYWDIIDKLKLCVWPMAILSARNPPIRVVEKTFNTLTWDMSIITQNVSEAEFLDHIHFNHWAYNKLYINSNISQNTLTRVIDKLPHNSNYWYDNTMSFELDYIFKYPTKKWDWEYIHRNYCSIIQDWSFLKNTNYDNLCFYNISTYFNPPVDILKKFITSRWNWKRLINEDYIPISFLYEIIEPGNCYNVSAINYNNSETNHAFVNYVMTYVFNKICYNQSINIQIIEDLYNYLPEELIEQIAEYIVV